ncbi:type I polyketide synthase [Streptomyces sp. JJ36]|uniref:type I polyketide synthase n=1 Tax=Streptomyces sp. JJ36 TaxID=2736645 RepID=UPI001F308AE0|nr:type I polyketide synthase [Streptomyces sp. JJ36]MCF6524679.1 type I polyketide synthase [Streptomyces sp. JJ36]
MTSHEQAQTAGATLRRAYLAVERMQRRVDELEGAASEPVALIGLGCRFPGGVTDADSYWELLAKGTDAIQEIPADRWDAEAFHAEAHGTPGRMSTRYGGFLDRVDTFDHEFFGISRREAVAMDPQQRLALEVTWEALENAGRAPGALAGSRTGVFLGVCSNDFATRTLRDPLDATAYASTGTAHSVVPGRISYTLDLRGPSVAVDSACSASLVAVHQACQALRAGECDLAVGGGVNVILSPIPSIAFSQFPGMVAPDGRCKTFDASADGYVRGEGCGIVVLKRLSDALRDRDAILAVVRGGAVNQDGRSSGITAPNGAAQRDVLRRALRAARVAPEQVSYVEAHGTGTTLGDPIEVDALADVYGRPEGEPFYLGSSKTNIGHLEAASGIAGLIKAALCVQRAAIPQNVHFTALNPHLSFDGTTFAVPTELTPWPARKGPRTAGVSSFGFSGTNVHLLVEQPPDPAETAAGGAEAAGTTADRAGTTVDGAADGTGADARTPAPLTLSARTGTALVALAERFRERLATGPETDPADVCWSAATGRGHFRHRLAAVGGSTAELAGRLEDFLTGRPAPGLADGTAAPSGGPDDPSDVVFLFPGELSGLPGATPRPGTARRLRATEPVFRAALDRCAEPLGPHLDGADLPDALHADRPEVAQPALFAVSYALSELWRSWGVEPAAVLGHGCGELAAACCAGVLSPEDGMRLTAERARLPEGTPGAAVAAIRAPETEVARALDGRGGRVSVAAVDGPEATVIAGAPEDVTALCEEFTGRGVRAVRLPGAAVAHAPSGPAPEPLRRAAESVRHAPPRIPLVATLDGRLWPRDQAPDADYWCRHAARPVRFADGLATLREAGHRTFLETGPWATLPAVAGRTLPAGTLLLPSLRPGQEDREVLLDSLARLYARGAEIDWEAVTGGTGRRRVPLPAYPFAPTVCPLEPVPAGAAAPAASPPETAGDAAGAEAAEDPAFPDEELLHEPVWERAGAPAAGAGEDVTGVPAVRSWLVLADAAGVGDRFAALLEQRGERCARVAAGEAAARDAAALHRLVDGLDLPEDAALEVVHLRALDSADDATGRDACLSAVQAVQALAKARDLGAARLWLVTRGAMRTGPEDPAPSPAQAALWGLGRSLQQEHLGLWGGLVDLDPREDPATQADRLLAVLDDPGTPPGTGSGAAGSREDQLALRGPHRYVARLARGELPVAAGPEAGWRPDAAYLLTGGLGGLGLALARSMAQAGACRLVLTGRTGLPPRETWADLDPGSPEGRRVAAVRDLEALGASVTVAALDVADETAMREFLERYEREARPPIRGVVHAAGVGEAQPVLELDAAALDRQLGAKAAGARVLDRLFDATRPLDFLVLCSSAASVLSSPFTAGYAAANAFLDALAQHRRATGRPALSVNWGIWRDTGMAARGAGETPGLSAGMGTLPPRQALRLFHRLLRHEEGQAAVLPVDWSAWGRRYREISGSRLLDRLLTEDPADGAGRPAAGAADALPSREELLALSGDARAELLTERLRGSIAAVLRAGPDAVGPDQSLYGLGLDSLMAVEARNEIERRTGVFLPISVFLGGASVRDLAGEIVTRLAQEAAGKDGEDGGDTGQAPGAAGIRRVERSEDALARQLLEELERDEEPAE